MYAKLASLYNLLNSLTLSAEADRVFVLYKSAVPMDAIIGLDSDLNPIPEPPQIADYNNEEWYGAIAGLGNSVILIPFKANKLNRDTLNKIRKIFHRTPLYGDDPIIDVRSLFGSIAGSLDVLKIEFPNLWLEISKVLDSKSISEEDAIYILYDEEGRGSLTKSPLYLAHDFSHIQHDDRDIEPNETAMMYLYEFMKELLSSYEETEILDPFLNEARDIINYERWGMNNSVLAQIFDLFGVADDYGDMPNDVIGRALTGDLQIRIPEVLRIRPEYGGDQIEIKLVNPREALAAKERFLKKINYIISDTSSEGFFGHLKGKVILISV